MIDTLELKPCPIIEESIDQVACSSLFAISEYAKPYHDTYLLAVRMAMVSLKEDHIEVKQK